MVDVAVGRNGENCRDLHWGLEQTGLKAPHHENWSLLLPQLSQHEVQRIWLGSMVNFSIGELVQPSRGCWCRNLLQSQHVEAVFPELPGYFFLPFDWRVACASSVLSWAVMIWVCHKWQKRDTGMVLAMWFVRAHMHSDSTLNVSQWESRQINVVYLFYKTWAWIIILM